MGNCLMYDQVDKGQAPCTAGPASKGVAFKGPTTYHGAVPVDGVSTMDPDGALMVGDVITAHMVATLKSIPNR